MQQATIGGLTAEQIEVLKKEPDLEDIVPYKHMNKSLKWRDAQKEQSNSALMLQSKN